MILKSTYGDGISGFRSEDRLSLVLSLKTKHSWVGAFAQREFMSNAQFLKYSNNFLGYTIHVIPVP
jgi:hypothetical protein